MATDAADIGANFSNYRGDANLGGGNFGVVEINTKPLQDLAAYTYMYNRQMWQKNKEETDAKVAQLADLSNIALNNLRGKDKEQAAKEFADLQKYASEYARKIPKTPQERIQNELEWQTKYGAFKNNYTSGKQRAVSYLTQRTAIEQAESQGKTKEEQIRQLDEAFDRTDIGTPISAVPNFKMDITDIPEPVLSNIEAIAVGDNQNLKMKVGYYNPATNSGKVSATVLGFKKAYPKEGTPEYNALSPTEKNEAKVQATMDSGSKIWIDAVEPLNAALMPFVNEKGVFDAIGFENANASNTVVMNAYNALVPYNAYNRDKYEQAKSGVFNDKGLSFKTPANLNPNDFKVGFVDFAKGVTPEQLVGAGSFAKFKGDTFDKTLTETGNAIDRERLQLQRESNREELKLRWANYGLDKKKLEQAETGDLQAADGVLREITDIINKGDSPDNQVDVIDGNTGKKKRVFKIGDPTILQKFGNVDKDGTTTNVPDEARYNPKTNEIDLVYFQRDDEGNVKSTQTRGSYIRETKTLNSRTWANMVSQRTFSGQDRGKVNEIIQSVITKNGGDLYKIAKGLNSTKQAPATAAPAAGGGMTDAQFQEYLKKKGLK